MIVDFIAGARSKLDIAVQELDSEAIARAILAASWRGIGVTVFLEQDYLRSSLKRDKTTHAPIAPVPKPGETPEQALERVHWQEDDTELKENRRILAALLRSEVETRGDFNPRSSTRSHPARLRGRQGHHPGQTGASSRARPTSPGRTRT